METALELPLVKDLKQIKVDNWGTFFLQRLLQLYLTDELLDFDIKFQKNSHVIKVHRLVITTCTDYFLEMERQQSDSNVVQDNFITMPPDITYESVKSIIRFMYTGELEYWASEHTDLYRAAKKLKMSVLMKLLDAQSDKIKSTCITQAETDTVSNKPGIFEGRRFSDKAIVDKKSSALKRKRDSYHSLNIPEKNIDFWNSESYSNLNTSFKSYGGPSRFDLPEVDELTLGVFSSFDDITYNTQPIVQAPERSTYSKKMLSTFVSVPSITDQVNEFGFPRKQDMKAENSDDDWSQSYFSQLKEVKHISKKVRFDSSNKENLKKFEHLSNDSETSIDMVDNHAKIIREVLKKYPHLVKHSKNIRLKIMQKETKSTECSTPVRTKISYVVLKSDFLMTSDSDGMHANNFNKTSLDNHEMGPWKCTKCNLDEEYTNYFMYRRHMQDVHNEKFDPRICEHCGYKATKRNILMYHMYTKHNITPPKNMNFPKCKTCPYVGLSESLLARHQANHKNQLVNLSPTSHLDPHVQRPLESKQDKKNHVITKIARCEGIDNEMNSLHNENKCFECGKYFNNLTNLQAHFKSSHKSKLECKLQILKPTLSDSMSAIESNYKNSGMKTTAKIECQLFTENTLSNNINTFIEPGEINDKTGDRKYCNTYIQQNESDINNDHYNSNRNFPRHFQNFDEQGEIVTEIVEEFQAPTETKKNKQMCNMPNTLAIGCEESNSLNYVQNTSDKTNANSDEIENVVQYVEEETEILEYETNACL